MAPAVSEDLVELTLTELIKRIRRRDISSSDVVTAILNRIELTEPVVNAYASIFPRAAHAAAAEADAALRRGDRCGSLHGVPLAIKDVLYTRDMPTEAGSKILAGFRALCDARVVRQLRAEGALLIGKTTTHEFACGQDTLPTRNAWDPKLVPGGSSAGSAVALAVRSAFGTIGTDTAGSIRVPAALNGVAGLKPTFGKVSCDGLIALSPSLDTVGPMARTVEDLGVLMSAMTDPLSAKVPSWPGAPLSSRQVVAGDMRGVLLGVDRDLFSNDLVTKGVREATLRSLEELQSLGAEVVQVRAQELLQAPAIGLPILLAEAAGEHRELLRTRGQEYGPTTRAMLELGLGQSPRSISRARAAQASLTSTVRSMFVDNRITALVAPTIPASSMTEVGPPTRLREELESGTASTFLAYTFLANLTGQPSLTIPCGFGDDHLPVGLQLIGRPNDEASLVAIGSVYERLNNWWKALPPLLQ